MDNSGVKEKDWDLVIGTSHSWFDLHLKEVWHYRDLLMMLVRRDFVSQYKQTLLGPVWFIIQPILTTITFFIVFGVIANIKTGTIPQPLFYLSGVVMWSYFSDCLIKTSGVFKDNANIFGKVYFPRLIIPMSIVISSLIKFGVQSLLLAGVYLYFVIFLGYDAHLSPYLLLLPVFVLLMAMLSLSLGMIVGAMTTKYKDLSFLVAFGVQLLMYATPIIYPLSNMSPKMLSVLKWNPMAPIIEGMRMGLFGEAYFSFGYLAYAFGVSFVLLAIGVVYFNKVQKHFIDTI